MEQFDAPTIEYLRYAASIQRTTAKKFVARNTRRYEHLHPSLKRTQTLERFITKEAWLTISAFEGNHQLPSSYTGIATVPLRRIGVGIECWRIVRRFRV